MLKLYLMKEKAPYSYYSKHNYLVHHQSKELLPIETSATIAVKLIDHRRSLSKNLVKIYLRFFELHPAPFQFEKKYFGLDKTS